MLPLLVTEAISMKFNSPRLLNDKNSLFDISIVNDNNVQYNLTSQNSGFFVAFRYHYDNDTVSPIQIMNKKYVEFEDIAISYFAPYSLYKKADFKFYVRNKGYFARKVDFAVFYKPNFNVKDNGPILPIDGTADYNRGYRVSSKDAYNYSILLRNVDFPNVDTIYIKDMGDISTTDPHFYPFFKNETNTRTSSKTVIAFSWLNVEVSKDLDQTFGFTLLPGDKVNTAPRLFDLSNLKLGGYNPGDKISLRFRAVDFDESDEITIACTIRGRSWPPNEVERQNKTTTTPQQRYGYLTIDDYPIDQRGAEIDCTATDSSGTESNNINYYLSTTQIPKITSLTGLKPKYYKDEYINLSGSIDDDSTVNVFYRIGNGPRKYGAFNVQKDFKFDIEIPSVIKTKRNYTLTVWLEDSDEVTSDPIVLQFYLRAPENPQLLSVFSSDYAYERGKVDLVIFGEADDADEGQLLNFYSQFSSYPRSKLGEHRNGNQIIPFAFSFDVPEDAKPGIHPLTLDVVDDTNLTGDFNRSVNIRICVPGEACYEPGEEPTIQPSSGVNPSDASNAPENIEEADPDEFYKSRMPIVWVLTVFNLMAVIVLLVIGVFYIRKRMNTYDAFKDDTTTEGDEEISESAITPAPGSVSQTIDNPLFSTGIPQSDDVFANDYHEETTVDVFKFNHDDEDPNLGI